MPVVRSKFNIPPLTDGDAAVDGALRHYPVPSDSAHESARNHVINELVNIPQEACSVQRERAREGATQV